MRSPAYRPDPARDRAPDTDAYVLVYDGDCRMCQRWMDRVRRWDRDGLLEFVPFQDPGVPDRFPWIPVDAFARAVQLVAPDGSTWEGAGAAEKLAGLLPGGGPLAVIFRLPGLRTAADRVYRWIARNRDASGCGIHG